MIGLPEHGIKTVQRHVSAQKLVGHLVNLYQPIQLLETVFKLRKAGTDRKNIVRILSKKLQVCNIHICTLQS